MKHARIETQRVVITLALADYEVLLAAARRRGMTLQELGETLIVEALHSDLLPVILGEDT